MINKNLLMVLSTLLMLSTTNAGEVSVTAVKVNCNAQRVCDFAVTLSHADSGWEHYANRFEILSPDKKVLGTRVLHHPHVNEQPFTRSLSGVKVPPALKTVWVQGHDNVHGAGEVKRVDLP